MGMEGQMHVWNKEGRFGGRLVMVGFGCIGQAALPLLLRHIEMRPEQVVVVEPDGSAAGLARAQGATFVQQGLDPDNYR
jgi:homospermidine synthase